MDVGNEFGLVETYLPQHIIAIRLFKAAIFGAMIGLERELNTGGAGLRTHILIAVAGALFTILAFEIFHTLEGRETPADPIRAVEAVTAGIAFLGAGAIFRSGGSVQGLTTGAGCGWRARSGLPLRSATTSWRSGWRYSPYWCWRCCASWRMALSRASKTSRRNRR
ncbi:MAG: MgtC/SapB family protein [Devosia sp.]|uniref:MgtC/SapB family protein n=1 Tax=Devosia sp. TaxID=1871048 RepID=UPI002611FF11|nr:MgtC/SapB family protein [Devosia sp.]MDB5529694.1 MgtC/SapB family protein [Devosia sp.]